MKKRVFRTNARDEACVERIAGFLGRILRPGQWRIDLGSEGHYLIVESAKPDALIVQMIREAGFKAVPLFEPEQNPHAAEVKDFVWSI